MGVIKRQGIKNSIVNYIGVAIGAVSTIFIYPLFLEAYGLARFLIDTSMLLMPFVMVGMNALVIRYFPNFKDQENNHHGFLGNLLVIAGVGMMVFTLIYFFFKDSIVAIYADKVLISEYIFYIIPLTCLVGVCELLSQYSSNFQRIVIPGILNVFIKITLPLLILLGYHEIIGIDGLVHGIVLNFVVVLFSLLVYLKFIGQLHVKPDFSKWTKSLATEMRVYASYGVIGLLGAMLATRIDSTMIGTLLDEKWIGIYSVLLFMANVIDIPRLSIEKIAGPIISQSWKDNDIEHIDLLYKKTSINQLVIGLLLFIGIYTNLDSLFAIMPRGEVFSEFKVVVLLIGIAKLVNMAAGINHHIIAFSKYFKFNFYALILMAVTNIVLNILLIPKYGINGAALATLFSILLYNLMKYLLVLRFVKIQPFTTKSFLAVLIGGFTFLLASFMPSVGEPIFDLLLRSAGIVIMFGILILIGKVSEDINDMWKKIWQRS